MGDTEDFNLFHVHYATVGGIVTEVKGLISVEKMYQSRGTEEMEDNIFNHV